MRRYCERMGAGAGTVQREYLKNVRLYSHNSLQLLKNAGPAMKYRSNQEEAFLVFGNYDASNFLSNLEVGGQTHFV